MDIFANEKANAHFKKNNNHLCFVRIINNLNKNNERKKTI